ncbi:MAG: XrtA/PEP-CTERM system TPR-repeat protein PrsT [Betaproteobacteria bacterium]
MTIPSPSKPFAKCLGALAIAFAAACGQDASVEQLLADSRAYESRGDVPAAIIQLKNLLQREPQHAEARFRLGELYLRSGDPRAAEAQLRHALADRHDPKAVLPLLAKALFQQGNFAKVLEDTRSSDHGEAARQPQILALRGHAHLSLGQNEDAAAAFDEALVRQPDLAAALLGQARLALGKRDAKAALALVSKALASEPASVDAWLMKGDLERAFNRPAAALEAYRKAFDVSPGDLAVNFHLASFYLDRGELDAARRHVEALRAAAPDSALGHYLSGLLEFKRGNFSAAAEEARRTLKQVPDYLPALALAGAAAHSAGADADAENMLGQVLERAPASLHIRKLLAGSLLRRGKAQQALEVLAPALKQAPDDADLLTLAGEAHLQRRELPAASRYFETAAKKAGDDSRARTGLGLARLAAGQTERALADLESATKRGDSKAELVLASSLLAAGKFDHALSLVEKMEKAQPADPAIANLKGAALLGRKDLPAARRAFERALELQPSFLAAAANLAQMDLRAGRPAAARGHYEKIVRREPANVEALTALANLAAATGAHAEALGLLERAKKIQPSSYAVALALARHHFRTGDYASSAQAASDALVTQSEDAAALELLAQAQLRAGKGIEARDTYAKLAALYPKSASALYGLAGALALVGSQASAEHTLRKALELRPDYPEALASLAALQLRAGRSAEAAKTAEDIKRRFPKLALGHAIAGDAHMAERRYALAAAAYTSAFGREKSAALLIKLHAALRGAGREREGEALLVDWLKQRPDSSQIRLYYADAAIKAGNYRLAAEQYEIERTKQPGHGALLHNLVWCYEQLRDYARALEVAELAYSKDSTRVVALDDLARILLKMQRDVPRAVVLLEKALTIAPDSQSVRYHLAQAHLQSGDKGRARLALEQLLRSRQPFPEQAEAAELFKQLQR